MPNENTKTYKLLESERRYFLTVPKVLAQSVGLKPGDEIKWIIYQGNLTAMKV